MYSDGKNKSVFINYTTPVVQFNFFIFFRMLHRDLKKNLSRANNIKKRPLFERAGVETKFFIHVLQIH